jgi:hypothetical protein
MFSLATGPKQHIQATMDENSEIVSQNKPFLLLTYLRYFVTVMES